MVESYVVAGVVDESEGQAWRWETWKAGVGVPQEEMRPELMNVPDSKACWKAFRRRWALICTLIRGKGIPDRGGDGKWGPNLMKLEHPACRVGVHLGERGRQGPQGLGPAVFGSPRKD